MGRGLLFCILLTWYGCSGYTLKQVDNPFEGHGVRSIAIPTFVNKTPLAGVSGPFTKEIFLLLSSFKGLKVYPGEKKGVDAVLVGIIDSGAKIKDALRPEGRVFTDSRTGDLVPSLGKRSPFYLATTTRANMALRLILIKDPTELELKVANSKLAPIIKGNPKIIFNQRLSLTSAFGRSTRGTFKNKGKSESDENIDLGGVVNASQTRMSYHNMVKGLAQTAANSFEQLIIYAF